MPPWELEKLTPLGKCENQRDCPCVLNPLFKRKSPKLWLCQFEPEKMNCPMGFMNQNGKNEKWECDDEKEKRKNLLGNLNK